MRSLTQTTSVQYHLELGVAGMTEAYRHNMSVHQRIAVLNRYREGHSCPQWTFYPEPPESDRSATRHWPMKGGLLSSADPSTFNMLRLPSPVRDVPSRQRTFDLEKFGSRFTMCAVDIAQDLMVLSVLPEDSQYVYIILRRTSAADSAWFQARMNYTSCRCPRV